MAGGAWRVCGPTKSASVTGHTGKIKTRLFGNHRVPDLQVVAHARCKPLAPAAAPALATEDPLRMQCATWAANQLCSVSVPVPRQSTPCGGARRVSVGGLVRSRAREIASSLSRSGAKGRGNGARGARRPLGQCVGRDRTSTHAIGGGVAEASSGMRLLTASIQDFACLSYPRFFPVSGAARNRRGLLRPRDGVRSDDTSPLGRSCPFEGGHGLRNSTRDF